MLKANGWCIGNKNIAICYPILFHSLHSDLFILIKTLSPSAMMGGHLMPNGGSWPGFTNPSLAVTLVNNSGPCKFTHKRFCNGNIYLVHIPFIFSKKLQTQTILSDLKKTVISTFPRHYCSFYHSGDNNNGGCNPHQVHLTWLIFKSHSMPCDSLTRRFEKIT